MHHLVLDFKLLRFVSLPVCFIYSSPPTAQTIHTWGSFCSLTLTLCETTPRCYACPPSGTPPTSRVCTTTPSSSRSPTGLSWLHTSTLGPSRKCRPLPPSANTWATCGPCSFLAFVPDQYLKPLPHTHSRRPVAQLVSCISGPALSCCLFHAVRGYIVAEGKPYTAPVWVSEFGDWNDGRDFGPNSWFHYFSEYLTGADFDWGYWRVDGST